MAELERVLDVLLHDLRSPLSVASGYLRLLRLERLESAEDREKAWTQMATALTRMAHLCDEAVGFLSVSEGTRRPVSVEALVERVGRRCVDAQMAFDASEASATGRYALEAPSDEDRLAAAVAALLTLGPGADTVADRKSSARLAADHLAFSAPHAAVKPAPDGATFDPWQFSGLAIPLACHIIHRAGGTIRTSRDLTITFPIRES